MADADNEQQVESRRPHWFMVFVCNLIALVAFLMEAGQVTGGSRDVKWAASAISITFALSTLAVVANGLARTKFVGTTIEGGLALIVLAFWAAVMPALMNPDNRLATAGSEGSIENANLYFFSWLSLIESFVVFVHFLKTTYNFGVGKNGCFRALSWAGLVFCGFVVMVSAARLCEGTDCDTGTTEDDKRTKFAVALGVVSAIVALVWMVVGAKVPACLDGIMGLLFLVAWTLGIIFITFGGDKAPGADVGNLYFFTWGAFIISAFVTADSFGSLIRRFSGNKNDETPEADKKDEIQGEKDESDDKKEEQGVKETEGGEGAEVVEVEEGAKDVEAS